MVANAANYKQTINHTTVTNMKRKNCSRANLHAKQQLRGVVCRLSTIGPLSADTVRQRGQPYKTAHVVWKQAREAQQQKQNEREGTIDAPNPHFVAVVQAPERNAKDDDTSRGGVTTNKQAATTNNKYNATQMFPKISGYVVGQSVQFHHQYSYQCPGDTLTKYKIEMTIVTTSQPCWIDRFGP